MPIPDAVIAHLKKDLALSPFVDRFASEVNQQEPHARIYEELVCAIIGQQLSGKAAKSIETKFRSFFGTEFPTPQILVAVDHAQLRLLGLSNAKGHYIQNVAQFWIDNNLEELDWNSTPEEEIITLLTQIKGVGRWTVEMVLIFDLARDDVFPIDDLGVRNGMAYVYNRRTNAKSFKPWAIRQSSKWAPYRSWGSRLMWKAYDNRDKSK
jgi:DNA-3-methyladenine glycosylase II